MPRAQADPPERPVEDAADRRGVTATDHHVAEVFFPVGFVLPFFAPMREAFTATGSTSPAREREATPSSACAAGFGAKQTTRRGRRRYPRSPMTARSTTPKDNPTRTVPNRPRPIGQLYPINRERIRPTAE